jgi:outer membrane protease
MAVCNGVTTIARCSARVAAGVALCLSTAVAAVAADWSFKAPPAPEIYKAEIGARIWYGKGKTGKNLYDDTGSLLVSRLTYDDFSIFTGEGFARFDHNSGWFLKGYVGGGALWDGHLKDEDFPPVVDPYSATLSSIKNSSVIYGSADLGFKLVRGPDFHVGAFAGYHLMRQAISAYGCAQIASNPDICGTFPIPDLYKGITQVNNWHALRVGLDASVEFDKRWKFTIDAAYLPYVHLSGADAHWLRIGTSPGDFTGPVPEDGNGWGYQIDGFLSYRLNDAVSLGVGGRYWHAQSKGHTHFEGHVVGFNTVPQVLDWKTDNYGVFIQSSVKLGPHLVFGSN